MSFLQIDPFEHGSDQGGFMAEFVWRPVASAAAGAAMFKFVPSLARQIPVANLVKNYTGATVDPLVAGAVVAGTSTLIYDVIWHVSGLERNKKLNYLSSAAGHAIANGLLFSFLFHMGTTGGYSGFKASAVNDAFIVGVLTEIVSQKVYEDYLAPSLGLKADSFL